MSGINRSEFTNKNVYRDQRFNNIRSTTTVTLPVVDTSAPIPPVSSSNPLARNTLRKGKIAVDIRDCCLYLSNGRQWNFVGGCAGSNSVRVKLDEGPQTTADGDTIIFDTIESDPSGIYNSTTGDFTIPRGGVYRIEATLCSRNFSTIPETVYGVGIIVNGSLVSKFTHRINAAPDFESESISRELSLAAGDVVNILIFHFSSATADVLGTTQIDTDGTWTSIRRVE